MSTPSLFVAWSIDAFSLLLLSSIFAFAVAFSSSVAFGVWSISAFLASAALSIAAFASSFLTTVGWILLMNLNHLISQCLHLRYLLVYRILSCCYCFIDFRFCCYLFFVCRIRRLIDFCFLSFRRFIDCRFCFVFLNNRWLDIVNESKPFDFAVSTPSLFVAWSIDAFSLFTAHRFSLLLLFFVCRVWCLVDFRFLASAALSIAVLLRLS